MRSLLPESSSGLLRVRLEDVYGPPLLQLPKEELLEDLRAIEFGHKEPPVLYVVGSNYQLVLIPYTVGELNINPDENFRNFSLLRYANLSTVAILPVVLPPERRIENVLAMEKYNFTPREERDDDDVDIRFLDETQLEEQATPPPPPRRRNRNRVVVRPQAHVERLNQIFGADAIATMDTTTTTTTTTELFYNGAAAPPPLEEVEPEEPF